MQNSDLIFINESSYSVDFIEKIKDFKREWSNKYSEISREKTPDIDGNGKKIINKKGNYKFIEDSYMRSCLDKHFPGWSVEMAAPLTFLGDRWVVAQIHLIILDEFLIPFGINPPLRKYYGVDSVRIQYQSDMPKNSDTIIDVGDNCKQAVTAATKVAINRLTRIGDDVYGKQSEFVGAGNYEDIARSGGVLEFSRWIQSHKWTFSEIFKILEINSLEEIKNFEFAIDRIKHIKGIK